MYPTNTTFQLEPNGLLSPSTILAIETELYGLLDKYSSQEELHHREHLGVSVIGDKCSRRLWYGFRWCKLEQLEPRMRRLFKRGHSEEQKFADILTWMGFNVSTVNPTTDQQYKFSAVGGHYGGSGDSVAILPWINGFRILIEYKTHNTKSFVYLKEHKLRKAKEQHYIQMSGYGKAFGLKYGLYCAINKNDDDIYFELIELDWQLATMMEKKAADIISATMPPPRIAENPSYFECKWCDKAGICWNGDKVEINCRSCINAIPFDNGEWHCKLYGQNIPQAFVKEGCPQHMSINQQ